MKTSDFDYHLPPELIAQTPIEPRDASRLLVMHRESQQMEHRRFSDIGDYLRPGDLLVANRSRVIPARLLGRKRETGGRVEVLLIRRMEPNIWETLVKPGRRVKQGTIVDFAETKDHSIFGEAMERTPAGGWVFCFHNEAALAEVGKMPLPPYIHHPLNNPERYQTIYASVEGSVAAPTAGLHFTPGLMGRLQAQGVRVAYVTLHIGLDTFRPVQVENPLEHPIHAEIGEVTSEVAEVVAAAKAEGRKVIAVGTTTVRLLESAAAERGTIQPYAGWTRLFITPGYRFKVVDTMVTNFHLPRSTLLMLVSAFAGRQFVLKAYYEAVRQGYRFYSFGDATLIL